jgi:hypothetical protein
MMQNRCYNLFFLGTLLCISSLQAMVYDNRFLPLIGRNFGWYDATQSQVDCRFVAAVADRAYAPRDDEDHRLPEMFGVFDQNVLGQAITLIGQTNPLPTAWQGREIIWRTDGKMQMQGVFLEGYHHIYRFLSTGYSVGFMHVQAYNTYHYERSSLILSPADKIELDVYRRQMFQIIGVNGGEYSKVGLSDIDWYIRFGHQWDYALKFRRIIAGARLGLMVPSGVARDEHVAAAIPFAGGYREWGIYAALDALFEVKEDMKAGLLIRVNQRFARKHRVRMPVLTEPQPLGAAYGPALIKPGATYIIAPYIILENLQQGLGVMLQYTMRIHQQDTWHDHRCDASVPVNLEPVDRRSFWSSDIITLDLFYDFGKGRVERNYDPFVFVRWDIPYKFLTSERSAKTNQVSCGFGCSF